MKYSKSWTQALQEVQEQTGVRKVDFVDGITPDLQEAKPEFEVKYASSKKGPIKVSKFMSLEDAKKFLAQIKKEGMNGIISKGGKPVKEDHHEKDANGEPIPHDDEEGLEERYKVGRTTYKSEKEYEKAIAAVKEPNVKDLHPLVRKQLKKKVKKEEVEIDEKASDYEDQIKAFLAKGGKVQKGDKPDQKKIDKVTKGFMKKLGVMKKKEAELDAKAKAELEKMMGEETLDEANYELYHKDFSSAMQHAYAHAKKQGFTVDPEEIDNKVATGPRKPSKGKTNRYILGTDKKKNVHIQVANLDNKKFELNMYIEETELEEGKMGDSDQQHNALVATKAKILMKQALKSGKSQSQAWWNKQAKLAGLMETPEKENMDIEETIKQVVEGKYNKKKMEDASNDKSDDGEGMDKVDPKAVKKKFKDRKDKDLDNDGDTDGSDEYLHKKRKAISKSMEKEETDSPLYSHVKKLLRNK